jgi:putative ABC transport system permease protein
MSTMRALKRLREIVRRLAMLFRTSSAARELDDELRLHVDLRQSQLMERGLAAEEARSRAHRQLGNMLAIREDALEVWGWQWLEHFGQDVRYGARALRRNPIFAAAAIVTLGLATGATTAIFSLVNGVLLRPLPFENPDRLVQVYGRNWAEDRGGTPDPMTAPVGSLELESAMKEGTSFEGVAGYAATTRHLERASGLERVRAVASDLSFFSVLGADPILGRTFRPEDPPNVAVLSEATWRQRFDADPQVLGRAISLDGRVFTVTGVMSDDFEFPYRTGSPMSSAPADARTQIWIPLDPLRPSPTSPLRQGRVSVVARLKPGVSIDQASAELSVIAARVEEQHYRGTPRRAGMRASALAEEVLGPVRPSLWMLVGAVGLVLATACANIANLLLARMLVRTREVVTRAALGAGRLRLVRQFLAESLLLSLAGGVVGGAIAWWGTDILVGFYAGRLPRIHEVSLDWQAFLFLLLACAAAAGLFGLAPALTAARLDAHEVTKESGGHATFGRRTRHVRDGLVMLEVALAFVLAVGAALVIREIIRLQNIQPGMATENVAVLHMTPGTTAADYYAIEARVAELPGVRGAGFIQFVPLQNSGWIGGFEVKGRPSDPSQRRSADLRYVTPGYFRAVGIPIRKGRAFSQSDTSDAPRVILVNEALSRRHFPDEDPVGRELDRGTIVGVVGDVRSAHLGRPAEPEIYYAAAQNIAMTPDAGMSLLVRTNDRPDRLIPAIRSTVLNVNPKLAIFNVRTMEQVLDDSLWQLNLYRSLIGVFAALALLLAAVGLYGMIAYTAGARTREFAIRVALGSGHGTLARLIFGRGLFLAASGVAAGLAGVLLLTWWFSDLIGDIRPDVSTCAAVALLLLTITACACVVPSRRAASVDPVAALRQE